MESYIFLFLIALIGFVSKNKIVMYAAISLIILKLIPNSNEFLPSIRSKGLKLGIFIITLAILVPIATSEVGLKEIPLTLKSKEGIIAILVGMFAAYVATKGIHLQQIEPQIVVFVSLGVVAGVVFIGGSAVGPIVASGLTYIVLKIIEYITN
ncbi:DUF441 domain-containing protein [Oceanivirga miroungae]|uniref:Uncharacterized protein n=1 Tax=Oceanivirga miroungae TaxID=1130046 RepID=A0A6I8ME46_9FUSO|nr:DUF441 domain-containing protein [Oceanivirga miroungae]VWL85735.1 hypothetical protein OMES3154_01023 [Oceanivirga miroungae]